MLKLRIWLVAFFVILPCALRAQMAQIPFDQCVYRLGDNSAWATGNVDPSGWKPYTEYRMTGDTYLIWVRCSANFDTNRIQNPAVDVSTAGVPDQIRVDVYVDGRQVGARDSRGLVVNWVFPIPPGPARTTHTIAVRVLQQMLSPGLWPHRPVAVAIGDAAYMHQAIAASEGKALVSYVPSYSSYLVIFVSGLFLLGLFSFERSQKAAFWLGVYCCTVSLSWLGPVVSFLSYRHPSPLLWIVVFCLLLFDSWALVRVNFALNQRHVPAVYWIVVAAWAFMFLGSVLPIFLPPQMALPLSLFVQVTCFKPVWCIWTFACTAPFVAFWPWTQQRGRMRIVAALCVVWAAIEGWFQLQQVIFDRQTWSNQVLTWMSLAIAALVVAPLVYIFREQRIAADERAELRGELAAARQVQHLLIPDKMHVAPGITVSSAYLPAHEVGGDFYLCRALSTGAQRVILGDVSGNGVPAALTSALLLGAADRCDDLRPPAVLRELNAALLNIGVSGFTTCLCADLSSSGVLLIANAGQLPPYRNGAEIEIPAGLPLGVDPSAEYTESSLQLAPGDTLTFLSDGVLEARNAAGELFGFERTRQLSLRPAQQIADMAVAFGQQDDITVLTLSLAPHAAVA